MKKIGVFILWFITDLAYAQNVEFWVSTPAVVTVGEKVRITYTLDGEGLWKAPDWEIVDWGEGLKKLYGPRLSESVSFFVKDGSQVQCLSYSYTYVLEGVKEGIYDIDPAMVMIEGKQYVSNALNIKVVGNSTGDSKKDGQGEFGIKSDTSLVIPEKELYVETNVSRHSLDIGESLMATMKIYSQVNLVKLENIKLPKFTGFLAKQIASPQLIDFSRENYNGEIYDVAVICKMLLFPQHIGEITIDPVELECIVQPNRAEGQSFFDFFFGNNSKVRVMRQSKPVTLTVKELPLANKPAGFSGTVGSIRMFTSLSADTVNTDAALTYKVVFSGSGNLQLLQAPSVCFPLSFEVNVPKETRNIQITENGMTGTVVFEYVLIPRYSGEYRIPAFHFSYFDSQSNTYKTVLGKEYRVLVHEDERNGNGLP